MLNLIWKERAEMKYEGLMLVEVIYLNRSLGGMDPANDAYMHGEQHVEASGFDCLRSGSKANKYADEKAQTELDTDFQSEV
jgi:hypothetical protein